MTLSPTLRDKEGVVNPHDNFIISGIYEETGPDSIDILELPLFKWTSVYKEFLESKLVDNRSDGEAFLTDIKEEHSHNMILFKLKFQEGKLAQLKA